MQTLTPSPAASRPRKSRREATPEQKEAAAARRDSIRALFKQIAALPIEKRIILAAKYGIRTPGEKGRELSPTNQLMLVSQFADVTVVGGFNQWREVGRMVKKGQKALAIWVPLGGGRDSDGTGATPESAADSEGTRFILGNVFDISQTCDIATGEEYSAAPEPGRAPLLLEYSGPDAAPVVEPVAVFPITLIGDPDHAAKQAEAVARITKRPVAVEPAPVPADLFAAEPAPAPPVAAEPAPAPARSGGMTLIPDATRTAGEEKIVSVSVIDPRPSKGPRGYSVAVEYIGEHGRTGRAHVSATRLRDLPAAIERDARNVAAGGVSFSNGFISHRFTMGF